MSKQSVIVNFNPLNQNSKAYDYTQAFNKELRVGPNAEVCLYEGELSRKPFVLTEDCELTLELTYSMPNDRQRDLNDVPTNNLVGMPNNLSNAYIQAVIEKGEYTKSELLQEMSAKMNDELKDFNKAHGGYATKGAINYYHKPATPSGHAAGTHSTNNHLPYVFHHEDTNDGLYVGLKLDLDRTAMIVDTSNTNGETSDVNVGMTNNLTDPTHQHNGEDVYYPKTEDTSANCPNFVKGFQPLFGFAYNKVEGGRYGYLDDGQRAAEPCVNFFDFGVEMTNEGTGGTTDFDKVIHCQFGNNDFWSGGPTNAACFDTGNIYPRFHTAAGGESECPTAFLGLRLWKTKTGGDYTAHATIYQNQGLMELKDTFINSGSAGWQTYYDAGLSTEMEEVLHIDLDQMANEAFVDGNYTRWKWVFYADDVGMEIADPDAQRTPKRNYYYQLLVQMPKEGGGNGAFELVYDSGMDARYIPSYLFESGFLSVCSASRRPGGDTNAVSMGITPMFIFDGCSATTGTGTDPIDYVYNPEGTWAFRFKENLVSPGVEETYLLNRGLNFYSMSSVRELRKILGIRETTIETLKQLTPVNLNNPERYNNQNRGWSLRNPNMFPRYRGDDAGFNRLYQDGIKYNIEIPNFPIRTFNTTSRSRYLLQTINPQYGTSVIVGNERPIIYNVKSFGEDATDIEEVEVRRQLIPNNLKWLSLNNREPLKINELNIQVRRALDNVLAPEITDCMVEVLIQSADPNAVRLQYDYNP